MFAHTTDSSVATREQLSTLDSMMAGPEAAISDAPLYAPQAGVAVLLLNLAALSPKTPKESKRR